MLDPNRPTTVGHLLLAKRKAGTPLSEAEHAQRVAAAKARWMGTAVRRVLDARRLGEKLVYRGAPKADFKPQNRDYNATYVSREKGHAREYAETSTLVLQPNSKKNFKIYQTKYGPGWITAFGLAPQAKLLDVHHLNGEPYPSEHARQYKRRHELVLYSQIYKGGLRRARAKIREHEAEDDSTPGEPDVYLEAAHVRPYPEMKRFQERRGYAGTANGRSLAVTDTSVLRPLYARHRDSGAIRLAKRLAGAPLSEAEHAERVAAARARWDAAAGIVGSVAGGAAAIATAHKVGELLGEVREASTASAREALAGLRETRTRNTARAARHAAAEAEVVAGLRPTNGGRFNSYAERTMGSQLRRAENDVRPHAEAAAPFLQDPHTTYNFDDLASAQARAQGLRDRLNDLKAHGRGAQRVDVEAAKPHDVAGYTAIRKGPPEALWEPFANHKLKHLLQQLELPQPEPPRPGSVDQTASLFSLERYVQKVTDWTAAHTGGPVAGGVLEDHVDPKTLREVLQHVRSLDDIEALVKDMKKVQRDAWLKSYLLPNFKTIRPEKRIVVPEVKAREGTAHRKTIEGYPDRATRKRLADELKPDVEARAAAWRGPEATRASESVLAAKAAARQAAASSLRRLAWLTPRTRLGLAGGAAALAGLGGFLAVTRTQQWMNKGFDAGEHPRDARGQFAAAGAERTAFARGGDPPRVTVLIGMPGSGKSTWRAIGMARDAVRPTTIISTDDQVEDIGRLKGLSFSEAFKLLDHKQVNKGHVIALRAAVKAGNDIIIDKVNASRAGRARMLRHVPKHYERHAVVFHVPESELQVRRANRPGKHIPVRALAEMRHAWSPPGANEFDHVHRVRPNVDSGSLRKAAPPPESPRPLAAADKAEATMARRLAAMFGAWTDTAQATLLGTDSATMLPNMAADLDVAMEPLDDAVRAGAAQPVLSGEAGKSIAFTFSGRSPAVTAFVDAYRQDRIAELVDEQRAAIKQQLLDAAMEGKSPDEMARRVRDVVGLTSFQMSHVNNYRAELEELKGGALVRQLRDRRYDGPITRAIDTGTPIPPDKIDQYVDAYHRKYLAYRAMTIARTEGVGGANNGQAAVASMLADQHPGMELRKTWVAKIDGHTRDDHRELNGKSVIGLDTPFKCDSGDLIRWPHDPRAPARQIIQCRCTWFTQLVPIAESPDSATAEQSEN